MNKQGSAKLFGLMIGLTIIILALALAPALRETTTTAMNSTDGDTIGMDCANVSISNFDKAACISADISPFYLVGVLILIGGGFITFKVAFG